MTMGAARPASASDSASAPDPPLDAASELARLGALPLERRPAALSETVRRLEEALDATEARRPVP